MRTLHMPQCEAANSGLQKLWHALYVMSSGTLDAQGGPSRQKPQPLHCGGGPRRSVHEDANGAIMSALEEGGECALQREQ